MENFFYKKKLIGVRVSSFARGLNQLSDQSEPLQILSIKHARGKKILPHMHEPLKRVTDTLQECIIVIKGKIKIDLYGEDKEHFTQLYLNAGELFVFVSGGHALHIMEDTEMFEIKNGPFINDRVNI